MESFTRVVAVAVAALIVSAACGSQSSSGPSASPSKPANASAALDLLDHSSMRNGHFQASMTGSPGDSQSGEGWVSFRPSMADYSLVTGVVGGQQTFSELLDVGSVSYFRQGPALEKETTKWTLTAFDFLASSPSEFMLTVAKTSSSVRSELFTDRVGTGIAWRVAAALSGDTVVQLWIRPADGYLLRWRTSWPDGHLWTWTFDRFNYDPPTISRPGSAQVIDQVSGTCGSATVLDNSVTTGARLCDYRALGAPISSTDFGTVTTLPESLTAYVVDYVDKTSREGEGVTVSGGAAVFKSESWDHEVVLQLNPEAANIVVVADYVQQGAANGSIVGVAIRCGSGCLVFEVAPDGSWLMEERVPGGDTYTEVMRGMMGGQIVSTKHPGAVPGTGELHVNQTGPNRLVAWADGDQVGVALNGTLLGTYATTNGESGAAFFFHRSLSHTAPSEARLSRLDFYVPNNLTLGEWMGQ